MASDPKGGSMALPFLFSVKKMEGIVLDPMMMSKLGRRSVRVEPSETSPVIERSEPVVRVAELALKFGGIFIALDTPPYRVVANLGLFQHIPPPKRF